ncbi:VOC family protein [Acinetobacter pragensis]|uniref:Glyoxalase n=1 Tax=Acinetobacter pragensis TaxID=1806892 RepID=A0A151Y465_9GAMM|nr:glyoxalase [Acinetobacter pragensis]KYQ72769.1 glyoxalase [Acinetobacter pragensis]
MNYAYLKERNEQPTARAIRLAYLNFSSPDLELAKQFLLDFGLTVLEQNEREIFFRAKGASTYCYHLSLAPQAKFLGFALEVSSENELQNLSNLPNATAVQNSSKPNAGQYVELTDPAGFTVTAIYGQQFLDALPYRPALAMNLDLQADRINQTQRPPIVPAEILRLGHVVLEAANFEQTFKWYQNNFGLIASDVQVFADGSPGVAFLRLNLKDVPADHHTLALAQGVFSTYSHSAYEVVDTDAIGMGQRVLRDKGWNHAWGMGRHILGSQIFDYWNNPWGQKHEHYCDGDLFDASVETGIHPISKKAMAQWGPLMPASFTKPHLTFTHLSETVKHLKNTPDLTLKKVYTLAKIFM